MFNSITRGNLRTIWRKFSTESKKLVDVVVDSQTGIASVILQRPPVNSLNLEIMTELSGALGDLEKNECKGVILRSSLEKLFSAGFDYKEMHKPTLERAKKFWTSVQDVWIKLYGHSAPTVACMHGATPAGACILTLGCEYRVMVKGGSIGLNETHMGFSPPMWFIETMEDIIGRRQSELALTSGRMFSAEEALSYGLIDEIAENKEEAFSKSIAFCNLFKNIPPKARATTKKLIRNRRLQAFIENREQDFKECYEDAISDVAEESFDSFMKSMKKK
ncbi:enoyl-CoA delta isomerase 1, mitochondrial-like [Coccinella septempunctata]|uniref:enoyl-CoA delta isomerase 1, mitochondrial-like n=1 Tax=Coccinella septempunctata TaxID=41139 RepID=UPI001D06F209|nr:enoyl-CoA delta isomerase 1, mitochondrial-like [Coccinella septempunctata]